MTSSQAIFESILGEQWNNLPPVMHKHYANRPFCDDVVKVVGKMDIKFGWPVKLFSPFLRIFGVLVPYQGLDIPVTVHFRSESDSNAYCLDRTFNFPDKKPYTFYSKMLPIKDDIIIEFMKFGIGWRHHFYYNDEKIILEHHSYVWKIFGKIFTVPIGLLLGRGYAEEEAVNENRFRMKMIITHPLFGRMYEYRGEFEVLD